MTGAYKSIYLSEWPWLAMKLTVTGSNYHYHDPLSII